MKYERKQFMNFSDKNTSSKEIESKNMDGVFSGRTWNEIEDKELEMISGLDSFIDKSSQHICQKSKEIMKEWHNDDRK
jgi:hypothetical protein